MEEIVSKFAMFQRHGAGVFLPLCLVVYIHNFVDELLNVPTVRVLEDAVCRQYYGGNFGVLDETEMQCKIEAVQKKLLFLMGWFFSLENLPGIMTAIFWGQIADAKGRNVVLVLSCIGRVMAMLGIQAVGASHGKVPPEIILLTPLFKCIGGGSRVFTSIVLSVASDLTGNSERAKLFFFMALLMDIANVTAPPVVALSLGQSLWLPFCLSGVLFAILAMTIWALPRTGGSHRAISYAPADAIADATQSSYPKDREQEEYGEDEPLLADRATLISDKQPSIGASDVPLELRADGEVPVRKLRATTGQRLRELCCDTSVSTLLACSLLKQTAFFSESYFVQYASENYKLPYKKATWFNGIQATGAIVALGVILPAATNHLQRLLPSQWAVNILITRISLAMLVAAYASASMSPTVVLYAIAIFFCGVGEGAEPALQALASSLVMPTQYALLFTTMSALESIGRIFGSPFMAALLRVGRDEEGKPTGLVFLVASFLFLLALVGMVFVRNSKGGKVVCQVDAEEEEILE